ncbi:hypothetical protein Tco_1299939, partial [Tanacetum coccineum]
AVMYKNTSVTRVASFDNNPRGFKFKPFPNFHIRKFAANDVVGLIIVMILMDKLGRKALLILAMSMGMQAVAGNILVSRSPLVYLSISGVFL